MRLQPDFIHEFVPGRSERTLLLLHGTGGNERDLIPLGRELDPDAALLSPRGKVLENGMPRFFRRLAEGVFDLEDLKTRTHELADFVEAAARHYKFAAGQIVGVGYSNGANIAASMLLLRPEILRAAISIWRHGAAGSGQTAGPLIGTRLDRVGRSGSNCSRIRDRAPGGTSSAGGSERDNSFREGRTRSDQC